MFVRTLSLTLFIPGSLSLKDKRQVLQSLIEKVRRKFNVAVAEVGYQEQWQRSEIGLAFLSNRYSHLEETQSEIFKFLEEGFMVEITEFEVRDY
jgi:uncharacterized protein YlxP (DUF503 family)